MDFLRSIMDASIDESFGDSYALGMAGTGGTSSSSSAGLGGSSTPTVAPRLVVLDGLALPAGDLLRAGGGGLLLCDGRFPCVLEGLVSY